MKKSLKPNKKILRQKLQEFYKERKAEDGVHVGRRINAIIQGLHYQYRALPEERSASLIQASLEELSEAKKEKRFREDFPSFSKFKKFYKENELTLKDLKVL